MLAASHAFSSFSVGDTASVKDFYEKTLGLKVIDDQKMYNLFLEFPNGGKVMIYTKGEAHVPATFTVLNFPVSDIETEVDALTANGVVFEQYDMDMLKTDEKGIAHWEGGPSMAWFKDPAGNILSLMQQK